MTDVDGSKLERNTLEDIFLLGWQDNKIVLNT